MVDKCFYNIGDVIDYKYTVRRNLGEGSFGQVFYVEDSEGKSLALKLLKLWEVHPDIRNALVNRFDMEFQTGQIKSDYLVHSLSHGIVHGNPYIVMEYCGGGDLIQISQNRDLHMPTIAIHVLKGLEALHRNGRYIVI